MTGIRLGLHWLEVDERLGNAQPPELLSVSQSAGVVPRSSLTDRPMSSTDLSKYKLCRPGDLVLNRFNAYRGSLGVSSLRGVVSPDYLVLRPRGNAEPQYLEYLLKSQPLRDAMTMSMGGIGGGDPDSSGFARIDVHSLHRTKVSQRTIEAQRAIVGYLDCETTLIDQLIEKQNALIERLRERRSAEIERLVADEALPLKPLGATTSLIQTGPFGSQLSAASYVQDGTPVLNPQHLVGDRIRPDSSVTVDSATAIRLARHALVEGDVIAARRGELGRAAVVTKQDVGSLVGTGSLLIRPIPEWWDPRFLLLTFGSRRAAEALTQAAVGATMPNLNSSIVARLRLPCPDVPLQHKIVNHLDHETAQIDQLIAKVERHVELAKERRSALITAAVTGQIEVGAAK